MCAVLLTGVCCENTGNYVLLDLRPETVGLIAGVCSSFFVPSERAALDTGGIS